MRVARDRVVRWGAAVPVLVLTAGCARNVLLLQPVDSGSTTTWVCSGTSCQQDTTTNPAQFNQSNTTRVAFPPDCHQLIHAVLIQDAQSSEPKIVIVCAAPEQTTIPTTTLPPTPPPTTPPAAH
jgi:hypothetical protein